MSGKRKNVILTISSGFVDMDGLFVAGFEPSSESVRCEDPGDETLWAGTIPADGEERVRRVLGVIDVHPDSEIELIE